MKRVSWEKSSVTTTTIARSKHHTTRGGKYPSKVKFKLPTKTHRFQAYKFK